MIGAGIPGTNCFLNVYSCLCSRQLAPYLGAQSSWGGQGVGSGFWDFLEW